MMMRTIDQATAMRVSAVSPGFPKASSATQAGLEAELDTVIQVASQWRYGLKACMLSDRLKS